MVISQIVCWNRNSLIPELVRSTFTDRIIREQEKAHEREKVEAVESYRHTTRRQRLVIAALVAALLLILGLLIMNL